MESLKIIIRVLFLSGTILIFSCSGSLYVNGWHSSLPTQEMIAIVKPEPLRYYDEKSGMQYNVTNDSVNLYVNVRITEPRTQMRVIRSGMQIWLDPSGKHKKETGIYFPIASRAGVLPAKTENGGERIKNVQRRSPDTETIREIYYNSPRQIQLVGFNAPINGLITLPNQYKIYANIEWDGAGYMNYDVVVPFATFYRNPFLLADNGILSLDILLPESGTNQGQPGIGRSGTGSRGMNGGMGGMRMGGGMRGNRGSMGGGSYRGSMGNGNFGSEGGFSNVQNDPVKIKMKIKLAVKTPQ